MAEKVLYREWRPLNFDQVVGQEHVVSALRQAAINDDINHAYLFSGTRGTGKTSLAKIFARAINCPNMSSDGNPCNKCDICKDAINGTLLDVIEMDAASNNSVDNIRKITNEVQFLPARTKYKVYIIDEVHMLSQSAFNALLKTLEEPPSHVVFILATTEPQRIPATILSRCQRFDFKRIGAKDMHERLRLIADEINLDITDEALMTIISSSDGALRDAISLLDQARTVYPEETIERDDILALTGVVSDEFINTVVTSLVEGDVDTLIKSIDYLLMQGGDLSRFTAVLSKYYRDLLVYKTTSNPAEVLNVPQKRLNEFSELANYYSSKDIIANISRLASLEQDLKYALSPRITLEVALIELLEETRIDTREKQPESKKASKQTKVETQPEVKQASRKPSTEEIEKINQVSSGKTQAEPKDTKLKTTKTSKTKLTQPKTNEISSIPEEIDTKESKSTKASAETETKTEADDGFFDLSAALAKTDNNKASKASASTESAATETAATDEDIDADETADEDELDTEAEASSTEETPKVEATAETSESEETAKAKDNDEEESTAEANESEESAEDNLKEEATETEDEDAETADYPEVDVDKIFNDFIKALNAEDPLASLLLNPVEHYQDGGKFVLDFAKDQENIYAKIVENKNKLSLQEVLNKVNPDTNLRLEIRFAGDKPQKQSKSNEPEWVNRMRKVAGQLNVPIETEKDERK